MIVKCPIVFLVVLDKLLRWYRKGSLLGTG
jgi:hypothetical protein